MISRPYKPNWGLSQPSGHGGADTETTILGIALQKALVEQSGRLHMLEIIAKHHAHHIWRIWYIHQASQCMVQTHVISLARGISYGYLVCKFRNSFRFQQPLSIRMCRSICACMSTAMDTSLQVTKHIDYAVMLINFHSFLHFVILQ